MMSAEDILKTMISEISNDIHSIEEASLFNGGCERWLQMKLALTFVRHDWRINEEIFLEARYTNTNGAADMVIKTENLGRDDYLVLEMKIPARTAQIEDVINDLYKIWYQPSVNLNGNNRKPEYGAFFNIINPNFFDADTVLNQIIDTFHDYSGVNKGTIKEQIKIHEIPTEDDPFTAMYLLRHYVK